MKTSRLIACTVALMGAALPAIAFAQTAEQQECNDHYVEAQRARKDGLLLAARTHLLACTQQMCMDVIRADCVTWLAEIDRSIPSVVVVARDRLGDETLDVRVLVDGEVLRESLDASAILVDPGEHTFRFETSQATPVEQTLIVREGEQNRRIDVRFGAASAGIVDPERPPSIITPKHGKLQRGAPLHNSEDDGSLAFRRRDVAFMLGGVGVAALVSGSLFWIAASAAVGDLEASKCAPECAPELVDSIERQRLIGDVLAGVGVVSVGASVLLFMWRTHSKGVKEHSTAIDLQTTSHGARAMFSGRF